MILKCEYCKTHTALSTGMKMECMNCGASLKEISDLRLYTDQSIFSKEPINIMQLSSGLNYIEYNPKSTPPTILRMQSNF